MSNKSIENLLSMLSSNAAAPGSEKTASDASSAAPAAGADSGILSTIAAITEKTAAAAAPATAPALPALDKMASDLAASESDAFLAQSKLAGAAFCDSFMARLSGYDMAIGSKTASAVTAIPGVDLEKIAADAYAKGKADAEKIAQEEYQAGFDEMAAELHKEAAEVHLMGQKVAAAVLESFAAGQGA